MSLKEIYIFVSILISFIRSAWFTEDRPVYQMASFPAAEEYVEMNGRDFKREFRVSKGKSLDVDLRTGGSISVQGWDKDVVSIEARISGRHPENCKVEIQPVEEGIQITSNYLHHLNDQQPSVDLEIMVPQKFNLKLESMGGDFTIREVQGEFSGKTMGGALDLANLKGTIKMVTMGGEIELHDSDLDGRLQTMGGDVNVENVIGDVDATSMGGEVKYHKVQKRGNNSKSSEIEMRSMGGDLNIGEAPSGATLHTMGGDITVGTANDHVKAETMGGNIELEAIDGWIQATTAGGDVVATMVGDPKQGKRNVEITSLGGDVELTVPEELSMNVDLQINCSAENSGCEILSDFPLKQSTQVEQHHGQRFNRISATGEIAGGSNQIKIRTIDGKIHLKK